MSTTVNNKYIKQFRFYGTTDGKKALNYPAYDSASAYFTALTKGNIFQNHNGISKLGIQCRPNTRFTLNDSQYEIVVGETGIYEIDLEGYGIIKSIQFNTEDLRLYDREEVTDRLLIDIVYSGVGVNS